MSSRIARAPRTLAAVSETGAVGSAPMARVAGGAACGVSGGTGGGCASSWQPEEPTSSRPSDVASATKAREFKEKIRCPKQR